MSGTTAPTATWWWATAEADPGPIPTRTQAAAPPKGAAAILLQIGNSISVHSPPGRSSGATGRFERRQSDLSFPGIQAAFRTAEAEGTEAASGFGVPPRLHPALVPPAISSAFPSGLNRDRLAPSKRLPPSPANAPSLRPASQGGVRKRRTPPAWTSNRPPLTTISNAIVVRSDLG